VVARCEADDYLDAEREVALTAGDPPQTIELVQAARPVVPDRTFGETVKLSLGYAYGMGTDLKVLSRGPSSTSGGSDTWTPPEGKFLTSGVSLDVALALGGHFGLAWHLGYARSDAVIELVQWQCLDEHGVGKSGESDCLYSSGSYSSNKWASRTTPFTGQAIAATYRNLTQFDFAMFASYVFRRTRLQIAIDAGAGFMVHSAAATVSGVPPRSDNLAMFSFALPVRVGADVFVTDNLFLTGRGTLYAFPDAHFYVCAGAGVGF